jgi:uncharacterized membrane protein YhhN
MSNKDDDESVGAQIAEATGDLTRNLEQETPFLQKAGSIALLAAAVCATTAYFDTSGNAALLGYFAVGVASVGIVLILVGMTRKQI